MSQDEQKPQCRHKLANPNGGMFLLDEDNVVPQAFKEVLSKIAQKVKNFDMGDILKSPAPAYVHCPRSFLESAANDLSLSHKHLMLAAKTDDPIERIKHVICMYVGGHHINPAYIQLKAPINPVIGETIQRTLCDGSKFYGEQTSHHPPITNLMLEGPDNLYRFSGHFEYRAWLSGLNSIGGSRISKQVLSFKDGGLLSIKDPTIDIKNMLGSERTLVMLGATVVTDHINKLVATVTFNPPQETSGGGMLKSFKKKFFKSQSQQLSDWMHIKIEQKASNGSKSKVVVSEGQGSWLEYIEFDGKVYWTIDEPLGEWIMSNDPSIPEEQREFILPSDTVLRPDHDLLVRKDFEKAAIEKFNLEEQQRKDKAHRIEAEHRRKKQSKN